MLTKSYIPSSKMYQITFEIPERELPQFNISSVYVVASFNNWSIRETPMRHENGRGYVAIVELPAGADYEFRYLINDDYWYNDWNADKYAPNRLNTADNCVCCVPAAPAAKAKAKPKSKAKPKPAPKAKPKAKASKKPDDLKKVEGIGPKIAGLLNDGGIVTFKDLASAKVARLSEILAAAGKRYTLAVPDTWPEQAGLAAKGDWDGLKALQDSLKGGRRD